MADVELWDESNTSGAASSVQLSLFLDSVQDLPSFVRFIDALRIQFPVRINQDAIRLLSQQSGE